MARRQLPARLAMAQALLPESYPRLIELAADRALVTAAELMSRHCGRALALDIAPKPLDFARRHLALLLPGGAYRCRLSDGLDYLRTSRAQEEGEGGLADGDQLLLMGLGGLEAHDILLRALPLWQDFCLREGASGQLTLLLQVQKHPQIPRLLLRSLGFRQQACCWLEQRQAQISKYYCLESYRLSVPEARQGQEAIRSALEAWRRDERAGQLTELSGPGALGQYYQACWDLPQTRPSSGGLGAIFLEPSSAPHLQELARRFKLGLVELFLPQPFLDSERPFPRLGDPGQYQTEQGACYRRFLQQEKRRWTRLLASAAQIPILGPLNAESLEILFAALD